MDFDGKTRELSSLDGAKVDYAALDAIREKSVVVVIGETDQENHGALSIQPYGRTCGHIAVRQSEKATEVCVQSSNVTYLEVVDGDSSGLRAMQQLSLQLKLICKTSSLKSTHETLTPSRMTSSFSSPQENSDGAAHVAAPHASYESIPCKIVVPMI